MAFLRFPVPDFDYEALKALNWTAPDFLEAEEIAARIADREAGDVKAIGCSAIGAPQTLFEKFQVQGDHCHVVMCTTPTADVRILGRSYAWWNQRVLILDSIDPDKAKVLYDWRTPRPMNTRLGPENGVNVAGGVHYVISCHLFDDYWIANRTITDNKWNEDKTTSGFRILGASKDDANEFCECCLSFTWKN